MLSIDTVTVDGDEFMLAVPGASGHLVRTGDGRDDARIRGTRLDGVHLALLDIGFASIGEAVADTDSLILCTMLRTPGAGRWEGVPLEPGQTFVYPAGSTHHAVDPAGVMFAMTVVSEERFTDAALTLGIDPAVAMTKRVVRGRPLHQTMALFARESVESAESAWPVTVTADDVLESAIHTLAGDNHAHHPTSARRWNDADLVHAATQFLEDGQLWRVPMLTLCRAAGASERRLQLAFTRLLGTGPTTFMRLRALQSANRALRHADPATDNVIDIARNHGFAHPGRFAQFHQAIYGELPSRTIRSCAGRSV